MRKSHSKIAISATLLFVAFASFFSGIHYQRAGFEKEIVALALRRNRPILTSAYADSNQGVTHDVIHHHITYKQRYHEWRAALYSNREIAISSNQNVFREVPEFKSLADLGPSIVPYIIGDIADRVEGSYMLYYVILEIKQWNALDLVDYPGTDFSDRLLARLFTEEPTLKVIFDNKRNPK